MWENVGVGVEVSEETEGTMTDMSRVDIWFSVTIKILGSSSHHALLCPEA